MPLRHDDIHDICIMPDHRCPLCENSGIVNACYQGFTTVLIRPLGLFAFNPCPQA